MKRVAAALLVVFISLGAFGGTVNQNGKMYSKILGDTVKYSIYLPDSYGDSQRSYPIFYLLHGLGDDHRAWSQQGDITRITDKAIENGTACDMIIAMPDAKDSWYVNSYDGKVRYEDMFFTEFMPYIESTYRVRGQREFRAVGGLSMGGQGALLYSLKHPELFYTCVAFSSAVYTDQDMKEGKGSFPKLFERLFGKGEQHWKVNSVINLINTMPDNQKSMVKFWIDNGDDDFLYRGNAALHVALRDKGVPHQFRMRDGGHTWLYWRTGMPAALEYISASFLRAQ